MGWIRPVPSGPLTIWVDMGSSLGTLCWPMPDILYKLNERDGPDPTSA